MIDNFINSNRKIFVIDLSSTILVTHLIIARDTEWVKAEKHRLFYTISNIKGMVFKTKWLTELTLCMLCKNLSRWYSEIFFLFSPENRFWQFMHTCHTSHCETKSHRILALLDLVSHKIFKSHRIFISFNKLFFEEQEINHTLAWLFQA